MDRLIEAIEDKQNPSVVGLDPTDKLVPAPVMDAYAVEAEEQVESDDNLAATAPQQRISNSIAPSSMRCTTSCLQ